MNETPQSREPWERFVDSVYRAADRENPDRGALARLRRGLSPQTEARAAGDVLPYARTAREARPLYRSGALLALHRELLASRGGGSASRRSLGAQFRGLSSVRSGTESPSFTPDPNTPDSIAMRLMQLETQNLDDAAMTLHRLFSLAGSTSGSGVAVDGYALARLLIHWGDRPTPTNRRYRARLLSDYYLASALPSPTTLTDDHAEEAS